MTPESDAPDLVDSRVPDDAVAIPVPSAREMPNPTQKPVLGAVKSRFKALHGVAPGMRFWHGPADLRPPFGQGGPPFYAPAASSGNGVGPNQDLRQIQ